MWQINLAKQTMKMIHAIAANQLNTENKLGRSANKLLQFEKKISIIFNQ